MKERKFRCNAQWKALCRTLEIFAKSKRKVKLFPLEEIKISQENKTNEKLVLIVRCKSWFNHFHQIWIFWFLILQLKNQSFPWESLRTILVVNLHIILHSIGAIRSQPINNLETFLLLRFTYKYVNRSCAKYDGILTLRENTCSVRNCHLFKTENP